jgi:hypothetical protein
VYASSDKSLAVKVAGRYPNSVVKDAKGTVVHRQEQPAATARSAGSGAPKEGAE